MPGLSANQERLIKELIANNNKIAAIKAYREATGFGLKEAKDAVEAMERGESIMDFAPVQFDLQNSALLVEQIKKLLLNRQKIQAVRIYREAHNCGLKDAKDAVDAIEAQMRREAHTGLPSMPAISDDPFAEDTQRNRSFMVLILAIVVMIIGGMIFLFLTSSGF